MEKEKKSKDGIFLIFFVVAIIITAGVLIFLLDNSEVLNDENYWEVENTSSNQTIEENETIEDNNSVELSEDEETSSEEIIEKNETESIEEDIIGE